MNILRPSTMILLPFILVLSLGGNEFTEAAAHPSSAVSSLPPSAAVSASARRDDASTPAITASHPIKSQWSIGSNVLAFVSKQIDRSVGASARCTVAVTPEHTNLMVRGGDTSDSDVTDSDEYDSDESDGEESESSDEEYEVEEDLSSSSTLTTSLKSKSTNVETISAEYDSALTPPAMQQFIISIGVMALSNRVDILNPKAVRIARLAFVAYIIAVEVFLLYVRLRVKQQNDRTPITISNPLAGIIEGIQKDGGGGAMVKNLANQMLSTHTTIYEYDLQQIKKMNSGLLFPMVFLYFLHFRMKQVQPLLMQTATGVMNLVYSPLWQVYVLGRNLERPFKVGGANPLLGAMEGEGSVGGEEVGSSAEGEENGEESAEIEDAAEEVVVDDEDESEGEESDDEESEYDSDDE